MNEAPKLLIEWSSPWQEFRTAIRPALQRSPEALGGEAPVGLFPYRPMLASWVLEVALLVLAIVLPAKLASLQPYEPPPLPNMALKDFVPTNQRWSSVPRFPRGSCRLCSGPAPNPSRDKENPATLTRPTTAPSTAACSMLRC